MILSRQGLPPIENSSIDAVSKGAYIIKKESGSVIDMCILSTGSEVSVAIDVALELESTGKSVRVVSFPSFELFEMQTDSYKDEVLDSKTKQFVVIEAQTSFGWHKYIGKEGIAITVEEYGLSAPAKDLATHFGFTKDQIITKIESHMTAYA